MGAEEGHFTGGLPYVAVGSGPPLVVLGGLSAEHGPPSGMERQPPTGQPCRHLASGRPMMRGQRARAASWAAAPATTSASRASSSSRAGPASLTSRSLPTTPAIAWAAIQAR